MSFGRRSQTSNLIPLDPEIEWTFHKRNRVNQARPQQNPTEPATMAKVERQVREFGTPTVGSTSIRRSTIDANNFEIKAAILSMIQHNSIFCGLSHEDPNTHISNFLEICDKFKINGASSDAIRLRLFPFSLKEKAKSWLTSQPPNSITTRDDLATKFLAKFFSPAKTAQLRNEIMTFTQFDKEQMYEAWERYKELLRKCPYHE
ncbi:PREDICTED: LOW QUALITY PROTEIN [Prunus dulcis]|uniref:PREDICTED: LOW QUALITY PROTEIN n=1 Tax=Prunus dulcis TaxID=3755 RepID=A0A5E4F8Q9_PRUDU|nr:PREDICTED: LOW QUALITY PROTEIN [Prunus dulcis]